MLEKLMVDLGDHRSYPIFIGQGCLTNIEYFAPFITSEQVCIVTNETVAPLYLQGIIDLLADNYQVDSVVLPDGEQYKTLATVTEIYDCLLENKHNRTTTLIALGGGVIGDMTGFAAASYQRGVNFIQVPTTLLSQVDSSVGGKTGVNHPLGKNMIGAFHQPQCVVIDTTVLSTLPPRELSAGIAEVIKHGLIADAHFYQWLADNMQQLTALDASVLTKSIARSCQIKSHIVSQDEKESGIRAILNLGHTFGHAIEAAQGYGNWLHGEAVAVGMLVAVELSVRLNWLAANEVIRLKQLLHIAKLPTTLPDTPSIDQFFELMAVDKKVIGGQLRLVLLETIGQAVVTVDAPKDKIIAALNACYS